MLENTTTPKTTGDSLAELVRGAIDAGLEVEIKISVPTPKPSLAAALDRKFKAIVSEDADSQN